MNKINPLDDLYAIISLELYNTYTLECADLEES